MMDAATRKTLIGLAILLIVTLALSSAMGGMMGPGMMGPGMMGPDFTGRWGGWMWGAGMWLGGLAMLVFWGALIVGAVLVVRLLGGLPGGDERTASASALDILKRRYASGEVTREQYEQMRKDLEP
jgi:putative membrane protein